MPANSIDLEPYTDRLTLPEDPDESGDRRGVQTCEEHLTTHHLSSASTTVGTCDTSTTSMLKDSLNP